MVRRVLQAVLVLGLLAGCTPAGQPPQSPSPVGSTVTPASTPPVTTAPAPGCDLPDGVDPRACEAPVPGPPPIPESAAFPGLFVFSADDGRIRCDLNGAAEFVACVVGSGLTGQPPEADCDAGEWDPDFVYLWRVGDGWQAGRGSCRGDPLTSQAGEPPALPQGEPLVDGDLAVLAIPGGVMAWNGKDHHGLVVTDDKVVTW